MFNNPRYNLKLETRYSLLLVVVFYTLLAVMLIAGLFIMHSFEESLWELNAESLERTAYLLDRSLTEVDVYGEGFLTNSLYQEEIAAVTDTEDKAELSKARRQIQQRLNALSGSPYVTEVILTFPDGLPISSGYTELPLAFQLEAEKKASEAGGLPVWLPFDGSLYCVRDLRRARFLKLDHLAYLYLKVDLERMVEDLSQYNAAGEAFLFAIYQDGSLLYSSPELDPGELSSLEPPEKSYEVTKIGKRSYLVSSGKLGNTGWDYLSFLDNTELKKSMLHSFIALAVGLNVLLLLSLFIVRKMNKDLLKHFWVLSDKMEAFSSGSSDFSSFPDYTGRSDEIGVLHQEFDRMAARYDELIKTNYLQQITIKDTQIQTLSQQVNPEFLYNVLDSVYWSCEDSGAEDAAAMALTLSRLMRETSATDSLIVTASEELEVLDTYIELQQLRFPGRISYKREIDSEALSVKLPKLTLQLLAENAMKHAVLRTTEPCAITILLKRQEESLVITFANTGSAFSEEALEEINEGKGNTGLSGLKGRLGLLYGESASLAAENNGKAACVIITIPWQGEINVQSLDSL